MLQRSAFQRQVFTAALLNTLLWEQHPVTPQGHLKHAYASGGKVGFKLVSNCIQFYVFAN